MTSSKQIFDEFPLPDKLKYKDTEQTFEKYLFEDDYSKVSREYVYIKNFYFPTGTTKKIPFCFIRGIYFKPQSDSTGMKFKGWGMSLSPVWWACDIFRNLHDDPTLYNVVIDCGETTYKGFTTTSINGLLLAVRPYLEKETIIREGFPF